ncbi:MAG: DUF1295 domain-containing protein [Planctomycetota bacterium]
MAFSTLILINLAIAVGFLFLIWLLSLYAKDASIIDPCWGFGFVIVAWSTWLQLETRSPLATLLLVLVTIWGLRLTIYLLWRNHGFLRFGVEHKHEEDRRYRAMREKHGERFWWVSLFTVFMLQATLLWIISLTVQAGMYFGGESTIGVLAIVGAVIWFVGFYFETVGDWQLAVFKSKPDSKGKVFDRGLWRYTRHPNYFGDFCVWWGLFLVAATAGVWWTVFCPALMSFFLVKVSGVAMLERDISDRRPEYQAYIRRTNSFFPWWPKASA